MAESVEESTKGDRELALVNNILAWRAVHQCVRDRNQWVNAWPLTRLPDPYKPTRFAGTDRELVCVSGVVAAEDTLRQRLRAAPGGAALSTVDEEEVAEDGGAGKGPGGRKKKKKKWGNGNGAAAEGTEKA